MKKNERDGTAILNRVPGKHVWMCGQRRDIGQRGRGSSLGGAFPALEIAHPLPGGRLKHHVQQHVYGAQDAAWDAAGSH